MLTQVKNAAGTTVIASYLYDPFLRQTQKTVGSTKTRYVYAGAHLMEEYDCTAGMPGTLLRRYVYAGADEPILQIDGSGVVTYLHHDHQGSLVAQTNSSGVVLNKYTYSPFGESATLAAGGSTIGYTGQRYDAETGLHYYRARYYNPAIGRFLQPDPAGYAQGMNLYGYVHNDPINRTDPTGLEDEPSAATFALKRSLQHPKNTDNYWSGISKLEGLVIEEWRRQTPDRIDTVQNKYLWEQRTPAMGAGIGLFDIKDEIPAASSLDIKKRAAKEGNRNYGDHGTEIHLDADVLLKGAGGAQVINDYLTDLRKNGFTGDLLKLLPSKKIQENIRLRSGDNSDEDVKDIKLGIARRAKGQ